MSTQEGKSFSRAAATGQRARELLIDMTFQIPDPDPGRPGVFALWGDADRALLKLLRALEAESGD